MAESSNILRQYDPASRPLSGSFYIAGHFRNTYEFNALPLKLGNIFFITAAVFFPLVPTWPIVTHFPSACTCSATLSICREI